MEQKNQKKISILKIVTFESGTKISNNPEQDTCHWQSIFYETPIRFNILLREIFLKSGFLRVMKKYHESSLMQMLQKFGTL